MRFTNIETKHTFKSMVYWGNFPSSNCFSIIAIVTPLILTGIKLDPVVTNKNGADIYMDNVICDAKLAAMSFNFGSNGLKLTMAEEESSKIVCDFDTTVKHVTDFKGKIRVHITIPQNSGIVYAASNPSPESCAFYSTKKTQFSVYAKVSHIEKLSGSIAIDFLLPQFKDGIDEKLVAMVKNMSKKLDDFFVNVTVPSIVQEFSIPKYIPGCVEVADWQTGIAFGSILRNIPPFLGIRGNMNPISKTAFEIVAGVYEPTNVKTELKALNGKIYFTLNLPPPISLSTFLILDRFHCRDDRLRCIAMKNIALKQLRVSGETFMLADYVNRFYLNSLEYSANDAIHQTGNVNSLEDLVKLFQKIFTGNGNSTNGTSNFTSDSDEPDDFSTAWLTNAIQKFLDNQLNGLFKTQKSHDINAEQTTDLSLQNSNDTGPFPFVIEATKSYVPEPPVYVVILVPPFLCIVVIGLLGLSVYRHVYIKPVIISKTGLPMSLTRLVIEDAFLLGLSAICSFTLIYSNCTTMGTFYLGDTVRMSCILLKNAVIHMFDGGFQPLWFLVFVFTGIYPHFKIICVPLFTIVLQKPKSHIIAFIHVFGKFSFIDIFVFSLLRSVINIPGVLTAKPDLAYYLFVIATSLSILCSNYGLNWWRYGTSVTDESKTVPEQSDISQDEDSTETISNKNSTKLLAYNSSPSAIDSSDNSSFSSNEKGMFKRNLALWEKWLALPAAVIVFAATVIPCIVKSLQINIRGPISFVTGQQVTLTVWEFIMNGDGLSVALSIWTIIIAPFFFVLSYPVAEFLGAWASTDVFLLACIAVKSQLTTSLDAIVGSEQQIVRMWMDIKWPVYIIAVSVAVQWVFILKTIFHIKGLKIWKSCLTR